MKLKNDMWWAVYDDITVPVICETRKDARVFKNSICIKSKVIRVKLVSVKK